jgi:hypothetical protein
MCSLLHSPTKGFNCCILAAEFQRPQRDSRQLRVGERGIVVLAICTATSATNAMSMVVLISLGLAWLNCRVTRQALRSISLGAAGEDVIAIVA